MCLKECVCMQVCIYERGYVSLCMCESVRDFVDTGEGVTVCSSYGCRPFLHHSRSQTDLRGGREWEKQDRAKTGV